MIMHFREVDSVVKKGEHRSFTVQMLWTRRKDPEGMGGLSIILIFLILFYLWCPSATFWQNHL